jgi:hypothetical protein
MDKIKIVFSYLAYPFTIANYFRRALERKKFIELFIVGAFTNQYIPWNGGMQIPMKYLNQVDLPLAPSILNPSWEMIEPQLPWKPDLSLTVDAGWHYANKPNCLHAHVATDPHVLNYDRPRKYADYFFNMQSCYSKPGDIYLPYAFDSRCHRPENQLKEYDACLIGLHYANRDEWVRRLREKGISVNYRIGDIYDEYVSENCRAIIGLNWSSLEDVNARVFEIMAMGLVPVINRLPDLNLLGFVENVHYLGFSDMDEAVSKVIWAKENPVDADRIARSAQGKVEEDDMTYDHRVETILRKTGLL